MNSELFLERSVVEIDLTGIRTNYKAYKELASGQDIAAVVKANAYGHGDVKVARALSEEGVDFFAVSNINEGKRLRENGIKGKILILGYTPPSLSDFLSGYDLSQAIVSEEHLSELLSAPKNSVKYHIALDLGMKRIGLSVINPTKALENIKNASEKLIIEGVFTHFPVSDSLSDADREFTLKSYNIFSEIGEYVRAIGIEYAYCLNSAGGIVFKGGISPIRLGISLYGYPPSSDIVLPRKIVPVLSWKSLVCRVVTVEKGESIGYGRGYIANKTLQIATISTGYADGYPRALSNKGLVLIKGKECPIVGKICMDMMMVDVSEVLGVKVGDIAVLIGKSEKNELYADRLAEWANTISYEILTGISSRVARIYIE